MSDDLDTKLRDLGKKTLRVLHDNEDWGGDQLEEIALFAGHTDLASMDDGGRFVGHPDVCGPASH